MFDLLLAKRTRLKQAVSVIFIGLVNFSDFLLHFQFLGDYPFLKLLRLIFEYNRSCLLNSRSHAVLFLLYLFYVVLTGQVLF